MTDQLLQQFAPYQNLIILVLAVAGGVLFAMLVYVVAGFLIKAAIKIALIAISILGIYELLIRLFKNKQQGGA